MMGIHDWSSVSENKIISCIDNEITEVNFDVCHICEVYIEKCENCNAKSMFKTYFDREICKCSNCGSTEILKTMPDFKTFQRSAFLIYRCPDCGKTQTKQSREEKLVKVNVEECSI